LPPVTPMTPPADDTAPQARGWVGADPADAGAGAELDDGAEGAQDADGLAVGEGAIVEEVVTEGGGDGGELPFEAYPLAPAPLPPEPIVVVGPPGKPTLGHLLPWLVLCTCAGVAIGLLFGLLL